jgi:hypothetical protein
MKKFLSLAFMLLFSISYASAQQWKDYYVVEEVGQENASAYWFRIDWDNNYFFLDSDSEDETLCPIKNLKVNGNKKTFDVYYTQSVGGGKYCSVEFTTAEDGKMTLTLIMRGENGQTYKPTYIVSDKKPLKGSGGGDARKDPKELIKGGVDKVTNLFKKKKDQ